ncbi:MAG: GGDEF domain-containing protein [Steroidobacteraceae bacterium]|nr:GGDEF domain-containing protein [Steroidobacteraceae bacterium]
MTDSNDKPLPGAFSGEFVYGAALFAAAVVALALASPASTLDMGDWHTVLFFLGFGLFAISIGYQHPQLGYVSFDRVAQVSCILVLGPVNAAWINGLASLIYPWHRLRNGVPLRSVFSAALTNAGLMTLMMLAAGRLYENLGGPVPLAAVEPASFAAVLALLVAMQVINEVGMMVLAWIRGQSLRASLSLFDTLTELTAGLVAVLVAIVWTRMEVEVFLLLLAVLSAGMLALKRFAEMRLRLERLVGERTAALQDKTRQLERLASLDTLTGLHNRRHADAFLDLAMESAARDGVALSLALADVDHFKQINDGHSHAVGDRVLERVAQIMSDRMRGCDLAARYGGEEFLFCLVGMDEPRAVQFCEDLRRAVECEPWEGLSPGLRVTLSIGLATRRGEPTIQAVLQCADSCLYRAKHLGRNRVVTRRELPLHDAAGNTDVAAHYNER